MIMWRWRLMASRSPSGALAPQGEVNEAFLEALGVLGQKLDFLSTSALAQARPRRSLSWSDWPQDQRDPDRLFRVPVETCTWSRR